jgi:hypothetical protein
MLIYVNSYDPLLTLAKALGGDGAMPLFSHASLSRVICEAAIRFAWLTDPGVSSEERIMRGAAALYDSAGERSKGSAGSRPNAPASAPVTKCPAVAPKNATTSRS